MHRTDPTASSADATDDLAEVRPDKLAYSVPEAAVLISLSERGVWNLLRARKIKSFMEGGRRLISRRALESYVAEREGEAA